MTSSVSVHSLRQPVRRWTSSSSRCAGQVENDPLTSLAGVADCESDRPRRCPVRRVASMSNRLRPIHAGPPVNSASFRSSAILMSRRTVALRTVRRPPGENLMLLTEPAPLGLTTETANVGLLVFAGAVGGACANATHAATGIAANNASVLHARGRAMLLVMSTPFEGCLTDAFLSLTSRTICTKTFAACQGFFWIRPV